MSQLVLDEQLAASEVMEPLRRKHKVRRLREARPDERILDDRIPDILRRLDRPTFLTIDQGFWDRALCHPRYCILCFTLTTKQQQLLPDLVEALFRTPEFRTRAQRMGKVARISPRSIEYWQFHVPRVHHLSWEATAR
jgi:hypothetical protein